MTNQRRSRGVIAAVGLLALPLAPLACGNPDTATVLKLAHGLDTEHPVHKAMVHMASCVEERSGGTLRIDIYPGEQLGSERETLELVQLGILAMTKTSSGPLESFVPAMKVFGLPYLFRDGEHMWAMFGSPLGRELLEAGTDRGLLGLCFYDAGARSFYTSHKRIAAPADLAGLKIRVQKSEMSRRMILAMGGSPTPIDWGELYTSLQQGVVDGAENNPPSLFNARHHEISKYYTLDEHLRMPDVLIISPAVFAQLSDDHRRVLCEAVEASVAFQRTLWARIEGDSLDAIRAAGVEIVRPDKQPFLDAVQPVWADFADTELGALARRIQALE